jgi:hypothetical protein
VNEGLFFPEHDRGEGIKLRVRRVVGTGGQPSLDADIIKVFIKVPALFYRNLGQEDA